MFGLPFPRSFPRTREPSFCSKAWVPAFAGTSGACGIAQDQTIVRSVLRDALGFLQRARLGLAGAADRLDRAARLAGFFRDLGVLLGDDRLGRLVAVEAAQRGGRNPAVRALRAVLVIDVEQHEFADAAGAWFASHVLFP